MKAYVLQYALVVAALACTQHDARSAGGATVQATRPAVPKDTRKTVLFAGTSLTAGLGLEPDSAYPQQIGRIIDSAGLPYQVVNAGISGETSAALLRRVDWLLREPFDVIVIETGANDGLRGIPVTSMKANIQAVIDHIRRARPAARIALIQMEALPNLGVTYTRAFHDAFPEVARANGGRVGEVGGVALLPFLLNGVAGKRELNQADGIHPNYVGERMVARNVWKGLRDLLQ